MKIVNGFNCFNCSVFDVWLGSEFTSTFMHCQQLWTFTSNSIFFVTVNYIPPWRWNKKYRSWGGPIEFSLLNRSLQLEIKIYLLKIEVYFMKSKFILSNRSLFLKSKFIFVKSKSICSNRNLFNKFIFSIEVFMMKCKFNLLNPS